MAKKKKKDKKAKDPLVLPKRIAGVKIPKSLRRQSKQFAELARHPLVADVVAAGIVAFAAGMRDRKPAASDAPPPPSASDTSAGPPKPPGEPAPEGNKTV